LSRVMELCTTVLHPALDVNHSLVQCIHPVYVVGSADT
jgi:hypothetical protein